MSGKKATRRKRKPASIANGFNMSILKTERNVPPSCNGCRYIYIYIWISYWKEMEKVYFQLAIFDSWRGRSLWMVRIISLPKTHPKVKEENVYIKYLSQFHHHLWTSCRTYQLGSPSPISEAAEMCNDATMALAGDPHVEMCVRDSCFQLHWERCIIESQKDLIQ